MGKEILSIMKKNRVKDDDDDDEELTMPGLGKTASTPGPLLTSLFHKKPDMEEEVKEEEEAEFQYDHDDEEEYITRRGDDAAKLEDASFISDD